MLFHDLIWLRVTAYLSWHPTFLWTLISLFRFLRWELERRWVLVLQVHSWQVSQALPFPHKVSSVLPSSSSCCVSLNRAFCGRKITGTAITLKVWQRGKMKLAVFSNHTCSETNLFYESCKESLNCHWGEKGNPLAILCASAYNFSVSCSYNSFWLPAFFFFLFAVLHRKDLLVRGRQNFICQFSLIFTWETSRTVYWWKHGVLSSLPL